MRFWLVEKVTDAGQIVWVERPDPVAGPDEYVVRVEAAGVNFADTLMARGLYQRPILSPAATIAPATSMPGENGVSGLRPAPPKAWIARPTTSHALLAAATLISAISSRPARSSRLAAQEAFRNPSALPADGTSVRAPAPRAPLRACSGGSLRDRGVSDDYSLGYMYKYARTLRIVDGPDEVHRQLGRQELAKYAPARAHG